MIKEPTVLVLGAGASCPFYFPTGTELKARICTELNVGDLLSELRRLTFTRELCADFAHGLSAAAVPSVDAFLEIQENHMYLKLGKAAIAAFLLPCENTGYLFGEWREKEAYSWSARSPGHKRPHYRDHWDKAGDEGNWYDLLGRSLCEDCDLANFKNNKVSVITFNYDRSLEHYLYTMVRATYAGHGNAEYAAAINSMPIIHVHGSLGRLPWQPAAKDEDGNSIPHVKYDPVTPNSDRISLAAKTIKVIHEAKDLPAEFNEARALLEKAQGILLLGFGYHKANLERLYCEGSQTHKQVMGTARNLPKSTEHRLLNTLWPNQHNGISLQYSSVYNLLYNEVILK